MNSWKLNLALAIGVVILLLLVSGVFDRDKPSQPPLIALQQAPKSIRIHTEQRDCELQWQNNSWRVSKPVQAGVSDFALRKLLRLPGRSDYESLKSKDWAAFGLQPVTLSVGYDDHLVEIGNNNSLNKKRYVRINQQRLALLDDDFSMFAQDCPNQLLSKKLLPNAQFNDLQLPDLHAFIRDGQWQFEPVTTLPSQDALHQWLDQWRYAQAIQARLLDPDDPSSAEYTVSIAFPDQTVRFEAIRIREQIWWRNPAQGLRYLLSLSTLQDLLTPMAKPEQR